MCQGYEGNRCFLNSKSIGAGVGGEGKEGQNDLHSGWECSEGLGEGSLREAAPGLRSRAALRALGCRPGGEQVEGRFPV